MRLLGPLHAVIRPAETRGAAELVAYLDGERRRRGTTWKSMLADEGRGATAIVRRLKSDPGKLELKVVMRLSDALGIQLSLIDDADATTASATVESVARSKDESGERDAESRPRGRRRSRSTSAGDADVGAGTGGGGGRPSTTIATPGEPPPIEAPAWPPPLRPPRLGRYRDAPPESPRPPASAPATTSAPPRRSAPPYQLERAILYKLADVSAAAWRQIFRRAGGLIFGSRGAPEELLDDLADRTADLLGRIPRAAPASDPQAEAEPPTVIDPESLLAGWRHLKMSGELPGGEVSDVFDADGRHLVAHLCADRVHALAIAPAGDGAPPELALLVRRGRQPTRWSISIPLAVRVDGALHAFGHVRAGAVVGELALGDFGYLIAGVSNVLAIIELTRAGNRVVWHGRPEDLPAVDLVSPRAAAAAAADADAPARAAADPPPDIGQVAELVATLADEQAAHAQTREEIEALGRRAAALVDELSEVRAAAEERAAILEQENAQLAAELAAIEARVEAEVEVRITAERGAVRAVEAEQAQQLIAVHVAFERERAELVRERDEARASLEQQAKRLAEAQTALEVARAEPRRHADEGERHYGATPRELAEAARAAVDAAGSEMPTPDASELAELFGMVAGNNPEQLAEFERILDSPDMPQLALFACTLATALTQQKIDQETAELRGRLAEVTADRDALRVQFGAESRQPVRSSTFAQQWRKKKPPR